MQYREKFAITIRKFLMADFLRNQNENILSTQNNTLYKDICNQVQNRINNRNLFETTTALEVKVIQRLIARARDTQKWYKTIVTQFGDLLYTVVSIKSLNPGPLITKIIEISGNASRAFSAMDS